MGTVPEHGRLIAGRIRRPAVAGYFYPADRGVLETEVDRLARRNAPPQDAIGLVVPHGSFRHAGPVIGAAFARVRVPRRCIAVGPSHTGSWMPWSLMARGAYRTPLGDAPIDEACAEALAARCPFLTVDAWGQRGEHAIEVLVPFLQRLGPPDLMLTPVITGSDDRDELAALAVALAQAVRLQEEPVLLIASTDLSQFAPEAQVRAGDLALIDTLCAIDPQAFLREASERSLIVCGYAAAFCVTEAARLLGATQGTLAAYATSADAGGDPVSAIGYGGLVLSSSPQQKDRISDD